MTGKLTAEIYGGSLAELTGVTQVTENGLQFGDGTFIEFADGSTVEAPNA